MNIVAGLGTAAVNGQLQAAYKTNKSIGRVIAHKLRARPLLDLAGSLEVERSRRRCRLGRSDVSSGLNHAEKSR